MPRAVFVDTWGWIALGRRREARHQEIKRFYQGLQRKRVRVHSSDYVLDEVVTLLFRREPFSEALRFCQGLFAAAQQGFLSLERISSDRFTQAWALREKF